MSTEVKGRLVNMKVRRPGETDWKTLVCTEDSTFTITREVTEVETNCGVKTSTGVLKFAASGNAVQNAKPTEFEASYAYIKSLMVDDVKAEFKYLSEADAAADLEEGEGINNYGTGRFSNVEWSASASSDGVGRFSWQFTGDGNLDELDSEIESETES